MDTKAYATQIKDHAFIDRNAALVYANALELRNLHDVTSKNPAVLLRLNPMAAGEEIFVRMGMSFVSSQQACANAEEEIPDYDMERVESSSVAQFEDILNRIRVDTTSVDNDTVLLFYSSVCS
jgi:putative alpha-1,2-mannosidase